MNKLILLTGLPGSGKSTFVKNNIDNSIIVICADDFRKVITGQNFFINAEEFVWASVKTAVRVLINSHSILLDETGLSVSSRKQWINIAKEAGVPIVSIFIDTPFEECVTRNNSRERKVPQDVMDYMKEILISPSVEEGFYEAITVKNDKIINRDSSIYYENDDNFFKTMAMADSTCLLAETKESGKNNE